MGTRIILNMNTCHAVSSIPSDPSTWNFRRTVSWLRTTNLGPNRLTPNNSLSIELGNTLKNNYIHIKRIQWNNFNKELRCGKAFFHSHSDANVKQLSHYSIPTLTDDKPNATVIHDATNDILNHANHENIARSIINIGLDCQNNGVSEVFISSILLRKNPFLTVLSRKSIQWHA